MRAVSSRPPRPPAAAQRPPRVPPPATRAGAWRAGQAPSLPSPGGRWPGTRRWCVRRWARTHPQLARRQAPRGHLKRWTLQPRLETVRPEASAQHVTAADVLDRLLTDEVAAKREQSVARRTVLARCPSRQTRARCDCSVPPAVARQTLPELATGRVIAPGENAVCLGPPGTGKTPVAMAVGLKAVQRGDRTLCTGATTRRATRTTADAETRRAERLTPYTRPTRRSIDEIGDSPIDPHGAHLFCPLIARRDARGAILLPANQSGGQWGEVWGHPRLATAILDRVLHHRVVRTITGAAYRWRAKPKAGLRHQPASSLAP